jgi:EmrB/QacA subfamily drug resistance transporter
MPLASPPDAEPLDDRIHRRRWATLTVLCLSLLVIVVDNTIVNVALPTLVRELGTSISELQWVVDAYTLVFAGLLLAAGALGDRFGRKGALTIGLVIFGVASAFGAVADGVGGLIAARALMGIGAALIMPATLSILTNVFRDPKERALAIGIWSGVAGLAVALGPVAGGYLLEHFWWGSIFLVNVPIVLVALLAGRLVVPTSRDEAAPPIDWTGAVLSIAGLGALVFSLIEAPNYGWTAPVTLAGFALSVALLVGFVVWELRIDEPMLDMRFFRNARFSAASGSITLLSFALFGFIFMATQYLQFVLGYSAFAAGLRTLPFAAAVVVAAPLSSLFVRWIGTKLVVAAGMSSFSIGLLVAATSGVDTGYTRVWVAMLFMGAGMGLSQAPATEAVMGSLPAAKAGVGSAVNDTTREVGGALGVAVVGSILSSIYSADLADRVGSTLPEPALDTAQESVGAALAVSAQAGVPALARAAQESFTVAMSRASVVTAVIAAIAAVAALRFLPARAADAQDADAAADAPLPVERDAVVAVPVLD